MPIYEYACGACGHEFEEWQKMSDPPVRTCPKCKKKKVERLISQTAFQLKGGGWYADLYSSSKPGKSEGGQGSDAGGEKSTGKDSPSAKSDTKSESKSDSKSESKSDSKPKSESKSSDTSSKKDSKASSQKKSETRAA